jgi:hypothetical protein
VSIWASLKFSAHLALIADTKQQLTLREQLHRLMRNGEVGSAQSDNTK